MFAIFSPEERTAPVKGAAHVSIWCPGSSEQVYSARPVARCPSCGAIVGVTRQGHIKPHVETKVQTKKPAAARR